MKMKYLGNHRTRVEVWNGFHFIICLAGIICQGKKKGKLKMERNSQRRGIPLQCRFGRIENECQENKNLNKTRNKLRRKCHDDDIKLLFGSFAAMNQNEPQ